jgi:hypothetical protein
VVSFFLTPGEKGNSVSQQYSGTTHLSTTDPPVLLFKVTVIHLGLLVCAYLALSKNTVLQILPAHPVLKILLSLHGVISTLSNPLHALVPTSRLARHHSDCATPAHLACFVLPCNVFVSFLLLIGVNKVGEKNGIEALERLGIFGYLRKELLLQKHS